MSFTRSLPAILLAASFSFPAMARDMKPSHSQPIDLGPVMGDAFYTVEPDGFHVVATFAPKEGGTPFRVQALLAPGQSVVFSTPRAVGERPITVTIHRQTDQVVVRQAAFTD